MTTPARIIHGIEGAPRLDDASDLVDGGPCYLCALPVERGMPFMRWSGASFTDQNKCLLRVAQEVSMGGRVGYGFGRIVVEMAA